MAPERHVRTAGRVPASGRRAKGVTRDGGRGEGDGVSAWTTTRAAVPADLDAPDAWALHGAAAVHRAADLLLWGHDDITYTAGYVLARLRDQEYAERVRLVVTAPDGVGQADAVVATAHVILPRRGNTHLGHVEVVVHPDHRSRGLGHLLLAEAEGLVAAAGRGTVVATSDHRGEPPADDPTALLAPTGSGRIAATDPAAQLAAARGYALGQADRYSVLELPVDPGHLQRLHDGAASRAGADYRLVTWSDRTPDDRLEDMAELYTRMSTDAPSGELDLEEDPWDGDRIRVSEDQTARAGHGFLVVAAEHVPSGRLAAFTEVEYPLDQPHVVFQEDTLVLREHRGRRLGMLVKAEMLRRLHRERPGARRVHTWNAEENAHMLAINVALGFRPVGVTGQWQKHLAPDGGTTHG